MKIEFSHLVDGQERTSAWYGDAKRAISAAKSHLSAISTGRGWIYLAEEVDEAYLVTKSDMMAAGAAILWGASDWYSLWCASCGRELKPATRRKYFGK